MHPEEVDEITEDQLRSFVAAHPEIKIEIGPGDVPIHQRRMWIALLSAWAHRTPQDIMREMNPRMMDRLPTGLEVMAHDGKWIIEYEHQTEICALSVNTSEYGEPATVLNFHNWEIVCSGHETGFRSWPCDENINKVPWPKTPKKEPALCP